LLKVIEDSGPNEDLVLGMSQSNGYGLHKPVAALL
jgi:hypothetical protein